MADEPAPNDPKPKSPRSDQELLDESREGLQICIDDEHDQRALMLDDLRFATLDQWPSDIRAQREGDITNGPQPCLTIDQINQYITQVSNDMASNKPSVKVRASDDMAHASTADVFEGYVRQIEDRSHAAIAYQTSGNSAVTIGLGFLRIVADYVSPTSHTQELLIKRIPDTFSVYLSRHDMPDGSDAEQGWVFEKMPIETFKRKYPKAKVETSAFDGIEKLELWKSEKTITVCEWFYKEYTDRTLVFLADGREMWKDEYTALPDADPATMQPKPPITGERESQTMQIKWVKHTACEILERTDWKGKYIPIVEEVGKEQFIGGKRFLWGLVRPAKDSLRAFNYWFSALTTKMALSPKTPYIGAVGQFKTHGEKWARANTDNFAFLEYDAIDVNGNALPSPRRQEAMQMEPAMVQMMQILQNNVKASLGMYKASIGDTESQQSGRAILALKKESDTGTSHFGNNQSISVTHCGRILVDLIPYYADKAGLVKILGVDGKTSTIRIDPTQKESMREIKTADGKIERIYNLGVGKFEVTVTVGPGYTTSRQEAATVMTDLANTAKDPTSAAILRYGAIKNSDFHGSGQIVKMLEAMLPPQVKPPEEGQPELPPEAMQKIAQLTQVTQGLQQKLQEVGQENQQLKSGAQTEMAKVNVHAAAGKDAHQLKVDQAKADYDLKLKQAGDDKDFAIYKAKLDAEAKVISAEISSKADKEIALKQAEHAANVEFAKALGADAQLGPNGEVAAKPAALAQLAQVHQSGVEATAQAIAQGFAQMQPVLEAILQATLNPPPRKVSIGGVQKDAKGNITGANVATVPITETLQ